MLFGTPPNDKKDHLLMVTTGTTVRIISRIFVQLSNSVREPSINIMVSSSRLIINAIVYVCQSKDHSHFDI